MPARDALGAPRPVKPHCTGPRLSALASAPPAAAAVAAPATAAVSIRRARTEANIPSALRCRQPRVDRDLDLVAHAQRAHQAAIRLDPPLALADLGAAPDAAVVGDRQREGGGPRGAAEREVAAHGERAGARGLDRGRPERDRLTGQDLLVDRSADVGAVAVAQRLD